MAPRRNAQSTESAAAAPDRAAEPSYTVDQLAHDHGLPVSTLRLYQHRGLLPPPRREGRMGYYGPAHVARLELIAALQARGYSLASIKDLVEGWEDGRSLDDVLGLEGDESIWRKETPIVLSPAELAARFPGSTISADTMQQVVQLGLIELTDDGNLRIMSPRFLEIGSRLGALGFPVDEIIAELEVLQDATADIAARFTATFRRHLWEPFAEEGMPASRVAELTGTLEKLGPLAQAVVDSTLRSALQAEAQRFLDEQAEALAGRPRPGAKR